MFSNEDKDTVKVLVDLTQILQVFYKEEFANSKPVIDSVMCIIGELDEVPTLKKLKLEMLVKDIERNRYRVGKMLRALQDVRDKKQDLRRLVQYKLITWEQFHKLNELENCSLPVIAEIISQTKIGQGFDLLPNVLSHLKSRMVYLLQQLKEHGKELVGKQLKAVINELLRRGGIDVQKHTNISKLL